MDKSVACLDLCLAVLLADDNEPFRRRVRNFLDKVPEFQVVGDVADGEDAVRGARELQPDVVVMDVLMPRLNGIEATRRIRSEFPSINVIALSLHGDDGFRRAMLDAGATSYLLKDNVLNDLPKALRSIAASRAI